MQDKYNEFVQDVKNTFITELENGKTVGSISELYDSKKPFESKLDILFESKKKVLVIELLVPLYETLLLKRPDSE